MRKTITAALLAGSISLAGCATNYEDQARLEGAGTGAAIGAAGGAAIGAAVDGVSPIEGAVAGAAIGGLAGAIWADSNNDGRADGYTRNGQYYAGTPTGYDPRTGRACTSVLGGAATGAAVGAAGGAGAGLLLNNVNALEGAIAGAVIGGIAGAIWADSNNDGCVDGYTRDGQYYQGAPQPANYQQSTVRRGERG